MQLKHVAPAFGLAATAFAQSNNTLNATLASNPNLTNLTTFLGANPALVQSLNNAQNITIIAPNNDAFGELLASPAGQSLSSNPDLLAAVLQYHILNGSYPASQITNMSAFIPTLLTDETYANVTGGQRVEAVMIGNETVFYSGLLQNATVTQPNLNFTGGVIHVVDSVLTLPASVIDTALAANLTSFRGALNASDAIPTVNDTPDLTIFAPNNEAFRSVSSALANASDETLLSVLAYHVINGSAPIYSSDLMNGTSVQTLNGANLTVTIDANGTVFVNAARVVVPNILVANGVIHIIDNVLNPNATSGPAPSATSGTPAFTGTPSPEDPYTSDQPQASTQINPTSEGAGPASTGASGGTSTGAAAPMKTGAMGAAALFGAGVVLAGF